MGKDLFCDVSIRDLDVHGHGDQVDKFTPAASPERRSRISLVSGLTTALKAPRRSGDMSAWHGGNWQFFNSDREALSRASCSVKPTWASGGQ